MNKIKTITLLFIFLLLSDPLSGRDKLMLSVYSDNIYILDGFDKTLSVYGYDLKKSSTVNLNNVSPSGFFDFFSVYDPYRYFLIDSMNGTVWQLDGNYNVREKLTDLKAGNRDLAGYLFPVSYNSLITAPVEKDGIWLLRNGYISEIVSFESSFTDMRVSGNEVFVLFHDRIAVYSPEGIYKYTKPVSGEYEKIRINSENIFLYTGNSVTSVSRLNGEIKEYATGKITDMEVTENMIIYISDTELSLKGINFE